MNEYISHLHLVRKHTKGGTSDFYCDILSLLQHIFYALHFWCDDEIEDAYEFYSLATAEASVMFNMNVVDKF